MKIESKNQFFCHRYGTMFSTNVNEKMTQMNKSRYDSIASVGKTGVWWRADFQSGSRVLKKVFWTFSYLYLWHTMWFHAQKLLKTLEFWKLLNLLCKSGSRPQKLAKKAQKNRSLNRDLLNFLYRYGIFWMPPGESSHPGGSEYV